MRHYNKIDQKSEGARVKQLHFFEKKGKSPLKFWNPYFYTKPTQPITSGQICTLHQKNIWSFTLSSQGTLSSSVFCHAPNLCDSESKVKWLVTKTEKQLLLTAWADNFNFHQPQGVFPARCSRPSLSTIASLSLPGSLIGAPGHWQDAGKFTSY